ncbi:hypothetical protein KEM48_004093 [Puccinia striiformis f. sp. tritici PST-130]|nr:hypothetical protein KEM48_004093 [Puccinia striiformis f. sp. tritici PST-130]
MEAAELANFRLQQSYTKEKKLGKVLRPVVYKVLKKTSPSTGNHVGQFKDGLDMSAIQEVKFLQELSHSNVISVSNSNSHPFQWSQELRFLELI